MEQPHLPTGASGALDFAQGAPNAASPLSQSLRQPQSSRFDEDFDARQRGSSILDGGNAEPELQRASSRMSQSHTLTPSRGGTLKKKQSLKKSGSIKRSSSRRSSRAGSVRSLALADTEKGERDEMHDAFYTPVPTSGNPTDILADRFQAWRKVLKDLITYFRDVQKTYEARSKSLLAVSNVINNISTPPVLLTEGGIGDALYTLRDYHKKSITEASKARNIEDDILAQLTGLRSDLQQKIKEIKNLSGDFKNSVDKEMEGTRRAVRDLHDALENVKSDSGGASGKGDPYVVKLGVDRQVERQIDEENYLHRAFLNLENSGRELESIVVGEIQKAYSAYTGILKREADDAYETMEKIRTGPIAMAKDHEWDAFVFKNEHFVDPRIQLRQVDRIQYPGKDEPAASEVRCGMLERKSKYLKSYTPGWYVLSPTHLHEFKSADRLSSQAPIMSLYLPEQKLGSHSHTESSSHKFMLKGRQTGGIHRGHAWVFRAESHDTMLAWYEDIKNLTEKTGKERDAFVRRHARSVSAGSQKAGSVSSDGAMDEDEADEVPYSASASQVTQPIRNEQKYERPSPGGRFPSDMNVNRDLQVPLSPSSAASSNDRDAIAAASGLPGSSDPFSASEQERPGDELAANTRNYPGDLPGSSYPPADYSPVAQRQEYSSLPIQQTQADPQAPRGGDKAAAGVGGLAVGVAGAEAYHQHQQVEDTTDQITPRPTASVPVASTSIAATQIPPSVASEMPDTSPPSRNVVADRPVQATSLTSVPPNSGSSNVDAPPTQLSHPSTQQDAPKLIPATAGAAPAPINTRPTLPSHTSVQTISDLHIPGEFPRVSSP